MGTEKEDLDIKRGLIKRLIKLRGKTIHDVANQKRVSYFYLSRFMSGYKYTTPKGTIYEVNPPHIRKALADFLEIPYYQLWHKDGTAILKNLIEIEIARVIRILVDQNRTLYRPPR